VATIKGLCLHVWKKRARPLAHAQTYTHISTQTHKRTNEQNNNNEKKNTTKIETFHITRRDTLLAVPGGNPQQCWFITKT